MIDEQIAVARDAIRDLVARYNQLGDAGRIEALAELFVDDAVLETPTDVCRSRDGIRDLFTSIAERTRRSGSVRVLRHFTATHSIEIDSADAAIGICYYQVLTEDGLDHWGVYLDRYVRVDDRWLFAKRTATVDGMVDGGWGATVMSSDDD